MATANLRLIFSILRKFYISFKSNQVKFKLLIFYESEGQNPNCQEFKVDLNSGLNGGERCVWGETSFHDLFQI